REVTFRADHRSCSVLRRFGPELNPIAVYVPQEPTLVRHAHNLLLIINLSCCLTYGQIPSKSDTPGQAFTFRTRTNVVLIPAVVQNSSGQHMSGLGKNDFVVLENGKRQEVAIFEETNSTAKTFSRVKKA